MPTTTITFERLPSVRARFGDICRSTAYNRVADQLLTSPVSLGGRAVGWPSHELDAISAAILAGKTEDEIRALVRKLEVDRKNAAQTWEAA